MQIAIVGAGHIGSTLGRLWIERGHEVTLTFARDQAELDRTAAEIGAQSASPAEAAARAEVVLLAIPPAAFDGAFAALGDLSGRVLIDASNGGGTDGRSGAERVAGLAPGARVVKAINTVFAPMYPEAAAHPGRANMLIAGDDAEAKAVTAQLLADLGFESIDYGDLSTAGDVEALARIVITLAYRRGRGPFAYRFAPPDQL